MNPYENITVRTRLEETDDSGDQQRQTVWGRVRERFGGKKHKVVRLQSYGRSANPPKDSVGVALIQGGNPDQALLAFPEHPPSRPRGLAVGESKVYDDDQKWLYLKREKILLRTDGKPIIIRAGAAGVIHLNPDSE